MAFPAMFAVRATSYQCVSASDLELALPMSCAQQGVKKFYLSVSVLPVLGGSGQGFRHTSH